MGGVGNGVTEEDPHWDLNPGMAAVLGLNYMVWEQRRSSLDHWALKAGKQNVAAT